MDVKVVTFDNGDYFLLVISACKIFRLHDRITVSIHLQYGFKNKLFLNDIQKKEIFE